MALTDETGSPIRHAVGYFTIPEDVDVCCLPPLGYATEPFKQYGGRFSLDKVCYGETYGQALDLENNG